MLTAIGSQPAPIATVVGWLLGYHGRVLERMKAALDLTARTTA